MTIFRVVQFTHLKQNRWLRWGRLAEGEVNSVGAKAAFSPSPPCRKRKLKKSGHVSFEADGLTEHGGEAASLGRLPFSCGELGPQIAP